MRFFRSTSIQFPPRTRERERVGERRFGRVELDPANDPHARAALEAYADSCEAEMPWLTEALRGARDEPARLEPARLEPTRPDSARLEPVGLEPVRLEPGEPDPARPEPTRPDPGRSAPAQSEPIKSGPARPDPLTQCAATVLRVFRLAQAQAAAHADYSHAAWEHVRAQLSAQLVPRPAADAAPGDAGHRVEKLHA